MGTAEVVGLDVKTHPPLTVLEVREDRARQELLPQGLPETLDLPQRLRVVRTALDVMDPLPPQLLLEIGLPPPRRVLPALVGQDLPRRPVIRDGPRERLQDERAPLVMRDHQRHEVSRAIVHEGGHVHALVATEQEGEDVRLPELVRLRTLEATLRLHLRRRWRLVLEQAFFVQDPPDRRLRDAHPRKPRQHVADLPRPVVGVRALGFRHRLAPRARRSRRGLGPRAALASCILSEQGRRTFLPVPVRPVHHRRQRHPEDARHFRLRCSSLHHRTRHFQTKLRRPAATRSTPLLASRTVSCRHRSSFPSNEKEAVLLGDYEWIA